MPPLKGFPLEFCIGAGVSENQNDAAFRWSKKFSDRFSGFDTILECDSHPASHVAVAITLNAKASSLKIRGFSFNSRSSSSRSFYCIQPYYQQREKKHTNLKHSCMRFINNNYLIISGLRQFFYPLNSNCDRKFSQSPSHQVLLKVSYKQFPNFSRPSTRFPKQFKDFFSFMKFKDFSRLALNSRPVQKPWWKDIPR